MPVFWPHGEGSKYVRLMKDTYEDARTQVKTNVGVTGKITVRVRLRHVSSLSLYLFGMTLGVSNNSPLGVCCLQTA